jgi:transposase
LPQLTWLFIKDPVKLSNKHLFSWAKEALSLYQLLQRFISMIREKESAQLESWLLDAEDSGFKQISNFAFGLRKDQDAVKMPSFIPGAMVKQKDK